MLLSILFVLAEDGVIDIGVNVVQTCSLPISAGLRSLDRRGKGRRLFFFQAEDGIRDIGVTAVQTCALPISTVELIYAWHPDGFALYSMRSPSVSRLYLQVDPSEPIEDWSDDRIWAGLAARFALDGWEISTGAITEKSILPMRDRKSVV